MATESLQNELQEPEGVRGLAVFPVPPHNWYLRPGAMGKIHLQLHPLLCHRHGDLHLLCVCAHPRAAGTRVFLRYFWGPAREHYGTDELKPTWIKDLHNQPSIITKPMNTTSFFHFDQS